MPYQNMVENPPPENDRKSTCGNVQNMKMTECTQWNLKEKSTTGKWQKLHRWNCPETENDRMHRLENDRISHLGKCTTGNYQNMKMAEFLVFSVSCIFSFWTIPPVNSAIFRVVQSTIGIVQKRKMHDWK